MMRVKKSSKRERGAALVEFTIGALVFLTATFGVLEFSRLLWTHNALSDAARRGARYAVNHDLADPDVIEDVKKMAVYGNTDGTGTEMVNGLTPDNVDVDYEPSSIPGVGFGYPDASVTVSITNFQFQFVIPLFGVTMTMPDYRTTLTAESAGTIPPTSHRRPRPTRRLRRHLARRGRRRLRPRRRRRPPRPRPRRRLRRRRARATRARSRR